MTFEPLGRRRLLQGGAALALSGCAFPQRPVVAGQPGLVLTPGPAGWWDSERVSCPRVLREPDGWKMWYYGRDVSFDRSVVLPTGRIGLATSPDGIHWTRVRGPGVMGSVLDPSPDHDRFDAAFVGVSDVHRTPDGYEMFYFGGSWDISNNRGQTVRGFPARPGRATSLDGLHWTRQDGPYHGAILDVGPPGTFDATMVGWPQMLRGPDGVLRLYYHTLDPKLGFIVCLAVSGDGTSWEKIGPILTRGGEDDFDGDGPSTRQVFLSGGSYMMVYEGFSKSRRVSIGLATSQDGQHWTKIRGPLRGGAIFEPAPQGSPYWDNRSVGTPWIVAKPDGGWHLYYIGNADPPPGVEAGELTVVHQIGLAVSDGDLLHWHRWGA